MTVTDWRAWTAQNGGSQPGQTSPFPFPGVGPITDLIDPTKAYPPYPSLAQSPNFATVNAVDPFGGWTDQQEFITHTGGPIMRPAIPGLTSP